MKLYKLFLPLLLVALSVNVFAQSSLQLKRKKEALQREIELAQKNLNITATGKKLTIGQISAIKAQIRLRQEKISTINSEMKNLDSKINENTGKVHNLQTRLVDLKKEYAGMIRFAQRNKNSYDKMMFIFAAGDFNQAYKRIKYLQQFAQYRKKQAAYIQGTEKDLNYQIVVLDKDLKNKSSLLKEEQTEKVRLDKNRNQQAAVLNKLSSKKGNTSKILQNVNSSKTPLIEKLGQPLPKRLRQPAERRKKKNEKGSERRQQSQKQIINLHQPPQR